MTVPAGGSGGGGSGAAAVGSGAQDLLGYGVDLYNSGQNRQQRRWESHKQLDQRTRELILDLMKQAIEADLRNRQQQKRLELNAPVAREYYEKSNFTPSLLNRPRFHEAEGGGASMTPGGPAMNQSEVDAIINPVKAKFQQDQAAFGEENYGNITAENLYVPEKDPIQELQRRFPNLFRRTDVRDNLQGPDNLYSDEGRRPKSAFDLVSGR